MVVGNAISGACVGFLAGLSVSPGVAAALLSSVGALVVGVTSVLAGLSTGESASDADNSPRLGRSSIAVNPLPVTVLLMGIVTGVVAGIVTRSHDWLGTLQQSATAQSHQKANAERVVADQDHREGVQGGSHEKEPRPTNGNSEQSKKDLEDSARAGVLYKAATNECSDWRGISDQESLRQNLSSSKTVLGQSVLAQIVTGCGTSSCLRGVVEILCGQ